VLPGGKAAEIRRLQQQGQRVAMVGDGINDAPALTQADIGFAIGAGTDIAIESADIVIISDRLTAVMDAHEVGKRSYRRTKQNLALAFAFNGIGVPAAASGFVHPIWAMIAMIASVTAVLTNSFAGRLLRRARGERQPDVDALIEQQHRRDHDHGGVAAAEQPQAAREAPAPLGTQLRVPMHCGHCASRVEDRLGTLAGVHHVSADHEADLVRVEHTTEVLEGQIRSTLHELGFDTEAYTDEKEASA
jgi:cation transport ATPase